MESKEYKLCHKCNLILSKETATCPVCGEEVSYKIKVIDGNFSAFEKDGYKLYSKFKNNNINKITNTSSTINKSKNKKTNNLKNKNVTGLNSNSINVSNNKTSNGNLGSTFNSVKINSNYNSGFSAFNNRVSNLNNKTNISTRAKINNNISSTSGNNKVSSKNNTKLNSKSSNVNKREEYISKEFVRSNPVDNSNLVREDGPITIDYLYALDGVYK